MSNYDLDLIQMEANYFLTNKYKNKIDGRAPGRYVSSANSYYSQGRVPIINCLDYFEPIKIIGDLKNVFNKRGVDIYYRGQQNSYEFLQFPRFIRNFFPEDYSKIDLTDEKFWNESLESYRFWNETLNEYIYSISENLISNTFNNKDFNILALEPTLQHYGINTRWIDLVDNLSIGIWFSLFNLKNYNFSNDSYGYLFIYGVNTDKKITNGIFEGAIQRLVNLREAFQPIALRPHCQYAVLMCDKRLMDDNYGKFDQNDFLQYSNYNKFLLCVLKYRKETALNWLLGSNQEIPDHLNFETLFPSPENDPLYKQLLDSPFHIPSTLNNLYKDRITLYQKARECRKKLGKIEGYNYRRIDD